MLPGSDMGTNISCCQASFKEVKWFIGVWICAGEWPLSEESGCDRSMRAWNTMIKKVVKIQNTNQTSTILKYEVLGKAAEVCKVYKSKVKFSQNWLHTRSKISMIYDF